MMDARGRALVLWDVVRGFSLAGCVGIVIPVSLYAFCTNQANPGMLAPMSLFFYAFVCIADAASLTRTDTWCILLFAQNTFAISWANAFAMACKTGLLPLDIPFSSDSPFASHCPPVVVASLVTSGLYIAWFVYVHTAVPDAGAQSDALFPPGPIHADPVWS